MRIRPSFYLFLAVLLLALAACRPPDEQGTSQRSEQPRERPLASQGHIVYVGKESSIYTIRPDGTDSRLVATSLNVPAGTGGRERSLTLHTWPTWSPDGKFLSFSTVSLVGRSSLTVELKTTSLDGRILRSFYENPPSTQPFIGQNIPHYVQWSPDSQHLAFLAMTEEGVSLFVRSLGTEEPARRLMSGAPLYIAWSPDGTQLLIHAQERLLVADLPSLKTTPVSNNATTFRVPGWSRDGQSMAFLHEAQDGSHSLLIANRTGEDKRLIQTGLKGAAFLWSPTSPAMAVAVQDNPDSVVYSRLEIQKAQGSGTTSLAEGEILAFFWSPDGKRLAYVTLDSERRTFNWWIVNSDGSGRRVLSEFIPSQELLSLFAFFDQYAHSNSFWSPDSRYLVFAGRLTRAGGSASPHSEGAPSQRFVSISTSGNGSSPEAEAQTPQNKVYVIDSTGREAPRELAEGSLAFWSPK